MESARVQTPFVLLPAIPLAGLARGAGSRRTAFRGGRQNVAKNDFHLSSCIPLDVRGSRISVLFPSRARLRGSRRGCFDVLTKCHLGTCCRPSAFWRLRDRRRPVPSKRARKFPRAVFLPSPGPLEHTAVPTEFLLSRLLGCVWAFRTRGGGGWMGKRGGAAGNRSGFPAAPQYNIGVMRLFIVPRARRTCPRRRSGRRGSCRRRWRSGAGRRLRRG